MPNLHDLVNHVSHVLGRDASQLQPGNVIQELRHRGESALTRAAYVDPAAPADDRAIVPRRTAFGYSAFEAPSWYSSPTPVKASTRPPAKVPTSTTAIGAAEPIDADYAALVAELGINSAAVDLEAFKALVPRLGLRIYHRAEVTEYLHCQYKVPTGDLTPSVRWGWRPLREKDRVNGSAVQFNGKVQRGAPLYSKPIPYPVLLTVKAVVDACPSARCYVSDEMSGERIPDPFLLIQIAGEDFVIERWDEPAFRGKA